jgi:hypothetical protein
MCPHVFIYALIGGHPKAYFKSLALHGFLVSSKEGALDSKIRRATGMRSHDSTGQELPLYPLGQTRQLMKGKRKSPVYPLARFIH